MHFNQFKELVQYLAGLREGEAAAAFRQSLINDLLERGYSNVRAEQVLDQLMAQARGRI